VEPAAQLGVVADGCKKAYCPALGAFAFAICKDDFVSTPESLARDWPPLFDAIVAREAGMSATDVSTALLTLYVNTARKAAESASAAASAGAPPAPSGSAAPAPGPAVPASAASAGAPPTPSAGPAKPAGSAGTPRAKPVTPAPHPSAH
jgi:hypothetical protein